ncbi:hypothetical protein GCM10022393_40890 [Aquimarina addita]|uniref:cellulase n=1 Tax=Aquimarina addita TaxID=870485 RepID=A0ABP6UWI9_9FLAO
MKRYIYHLLVLTLLFSNVFSVLGQQQNFLTASGNTLYDATGKEVRLTGVNWFGFETALYHPHGIWSRDMKSVLQQIKDIGFNTIRVPWCNEMLNPGATVNINSYGTDAYSGVSPMNEEEGTVSTPIELMDIFVRWCQENDMKIVLDNHSRAADAFLVEGGWYTDEYSEERWIQDWLFIAERYKDYSAVVALDLNNEPHGSTWGDSNPESDWNKAAERCGNAILEVNPNALIIIEGVGEFEGDSYWWGGQLKGAAKYPIQLSDPSKLVYSAHEYGPEVSQQDWFEDPSFPSNMPGEWEEHFHYLYENNTSPIFVGEFGIKNQDAFDGVAYTWFTEFMNFMGGIYSWTFWTMNPNSGDTGGILQDDWTNVNQWKIDVLSPYFAPLIPNVIGDTGGNTAPIARVTASATSGSSPLTVQFDGSASSDADNDSLTYSWSFDDGTSDTGDTVSHTFDEEGIYQVVLTVNDGTISDTASVTITVSDDPAVVVNASISSDVTGGFAPVTISFDAGSSTSSDGSALTYSWDFGDDTNGNGSAVSHIYTNAGSFIVTVTVTNTDGISDTATQTVTVTEASGPTGDCSFGAPLSAALATIPNASYSNVYVVGNGGPDLSNVTNFTINWDLANNGLWQLSMNTNNGVPSWWSNLKSNITSQNFNSAQPSVTFSGTGFSGLDGSYYATVDGANFVLVSVDDAFTIYFSNSDTAPTCNDANKDLENVKRGDDIWKLQTNPSDTAFYLDILAPEQVREIRLYSITGQELQKLDVSASEKSTITFGDNLTSGMYLLKLMKQDGETHSLSLIKR